MPGVAELAELDDDELATRLAEYRRELLNLRFKLATSQLDNPSRVTVTRRDVARVLTLMREREIALAEGREAGPVTPARFRPVRRRPVRDEEIEPEGEELEAQGTVVEHPQEVEELEPEIEELDTGLTEVEALQDHDDEADEADQAALVSGDAPTEDSDSVESEASTSKRKRKRRTTDG